MRTTRNILLGLTAFVIGILPAQAGKGDVQKNRKSGSEWVSVGPSDVPGRVLAILVDKDENMRIYAGTAGGGLWITTNGGASWNRCAGYTGPAAVSAIAQGNDGRLYVGTGEGLNPGYAIPGVIDNVNPYGIIGNGVYVSDNKGDNFSHLTATASWREVNALAYDSENNKLYAATNVGLQVSSDKGGSFTQVPGITSKVFDVKTGSDGSVICTLYGDVRVSTDNGNTFTSACGTGNKIPNGMGRISVAIAPSDPSIMYAMAGDDRVSSGFGGVYLSENSGISWRRIFNPGGYDNPIGAAYYGSYQNTIAVSPTNPGKVLVGSRLLYEITKADSTQKDENGDILYAKTRLMIREAGQEPILVTGVHSIFYSGTTVYLATSSGILYSIYDGMIFSSRNRALSNLQIYSMSVGNNGRVVLGTRGSGPIYVPNPRDWDAQSIELLKDLKNSDQNDINIDDGGKSAFSMLKAAALFYFTDDGRAYRQASVESDAQNPQQWFGSGTSLIKSGDDKPRWAEEDDRGQPVYPVNLLAPTFLFWESVKDIKSKDSVVYVADKDYAPGEDICAKSARNRYPIWTKNETSDTLFAKDTLLVHDIITSRLFMGGGGFVDGRSIGAPVYMSLTALNFDVAQVWTCVFRTNDAEEQVMDMVVSKDGDNLFILAKKQNSGEYAIYRVSGFDDYRALSEVNVFTSGSVSADNPNRMLKDDTLLYGWMTDDILSIALDPQNDDNLIFTTNGSSRIQLIENATTADYTAFPVDKEGTGLPNNTPVYTALIIKVKDKLNRDTVYIGTERGVYRTNNFTSSTPTWEIYNKGIDIEVPVFKLYQQTKQLDYNYSEIYEGETPAYVEFIGISNEGNIYAATHGAGLFVDSAYHVPASIKERPIIRNIDNKLKVYPNPAISSISIDYMLKSDETVQLNIVDVMGRIVYTEDLGTRYSGSHTKTLDCSHLPNGFYFVNMQIGKQTKMAKFVIYK